MKKAKAKNNIEELRHNMINKKNWSIFVGDKAYKTNFFLRFLTETSNKRYRKANIKMNVLVVKMLLFLVSIGILINWMFKFYPITTQQVGLVIASFLVVILMNK